MSEELEVSRIVTERLGRAGIPYMLTGSLAMSHYAVPRMTRDIDLVVELSGADADRVCDLFEADFYADRDTVRRAVEARDTFKSRSAVQLADVRNLLDSVADLDRDYLREWTARLGLEGLYREVSE